MTRTRKIKILLVLITIGPALSAFAHAAPFNLNSLAPTKSFNLNGLLASLPAPIADFVNSVKLFADHFAGKIGQWLTSVNGKELLAVVKTLGNLIAWLLSAIADVIRWGVARI